MALRGKLDISIEVKERGGKDSPKWDLSKDIDGEQTLEQLLDFVKRNLIQISVLALEEEQAKGFPKDPVVRVDNRVGKPIHAVRPLGKIEYIAKVSVESILLETYDAIESRSPFDSGAYLKSNYVLLNSKVIAKSRSELVTWMESDPEVRDKDVIRFLNIMPYARKLERLGVTGQRTNSRQRNSKDKKKPGVKLLAENGAYFLASRSIRRNYKGNSKITFALVPGGDLGFVTFPKTTRRGAALRRTYKKTGRAYLYPCIKIQIQQGGLT